MITKRRLSVLMAAIVLGASTPVTAATVQSYPSRPVVLVVPFPAGGGPDLLCRLIAEKLRTNLGQPFVTENRAGGSGIIGAEAVARANPD